MQWTWAVSGSQGGGGGRLVPQRPKVFVRSDQRGVWSGPAVPLPVELDNLPDGLLRL